ncbi:hypothetical protein [Pandoraea soli]|uniref:hypothetical protein n=1 Tax=Pandoraea soli TaxID=2508293 RepID=UPI001582891B|nr:hypothetical protein [Pandoraea soli]
MSARNPTNTYCQQRLSLLLDCGVMRAKPVPISVDVQCPGSADITFLFTASDLRRRPTSRYHGVRPRVATLPDTVAGVTLRIHGSAAPSLHLLLTYPSLALHFVDLD